MKKTTVVCLLGLFMLSIAARSTAGGTKLQYKLTPGQKWRCTLSSQSESSFMGKKHTYQSKWVYEYTVSKGSKKGWVILTARIMSQGNSSDQGGMCLSKLRFTADLHSSGEIRNIQYSGELMPPDMGQYADQMTPQQKAMFQQSYQESYQMEAEAYKDSIFWFPEVPEDPLEVGDEFEFQRKTGTGGSGVGMQTETISKQVFTLEEVRKGLAIFSVKERLVYKTSHVMAGKSETKSAGKGDATFDLDLGMWVELVKKSRSTVDLGGLAGAGKKGQDVYSIVKYEMEPK